MVAVSYQNFIPTGLLGVWRFLGVRRDTEHGTENLLSDALLALVEPLQNLVESLKDLFEALRALVDSLWQLAESLKTLVEPLQNLVESLKNLSEALRALVDFLWQLAESLKALVEPLQNLVESLKDLSEALRALVDSLWQLAESLKALVEPLQNLVESLKDLSEALRTLVDSLWELVGSLKFLVDSLWRLVGLLKGLFGSLKDLFTSLKAIKDSTKCFKDSTKAFKDSSKCFKGSSKRFKVLSKCFKRTSTYYFDPTKRFKESTECFKRTTKYYFDSTERCFRMFSYQSGKFAENRQYKNVLFFWEEFFGLATKPRHFAQTPVLPPGCGSCLSDFGVYSSSPTAFDYLCAPIIKMLYPQNLEQKLGFDKLREKLLGYCKTPTGRGYAQKMRFTSDPTLITRLTAQAYEMLCLLRSGQNFPEDELEDLGYFAQKAAIEGSFLAEAEFGHIRRAAETGLAIAGLLLESRDLVPSLLALVPDLPLAPLKSAIDRVLDATGLVKSNASPELADIRRQLSARENEARKTIDSVLRHYKAQGYTREDAQPTIREGRLVLPIEATYKRSAGGLVHDSSATGQTLFVEPQQLLDLNNDVRELISREKAEIVRILTRLTNEIRPLLPSVLQLNSFLGVMDFVRAKARLAQLLQAERPGFVEKPMLEWYGAKHPLLQLSRTVVPLNLELSEKNRIIVISGPNAGGKSVALKTVALIQYMWQCGLLVPLRSNSQMGVFKHILLDIGDDQSLESDLSTYSSHLTAMKIFLRQASPDALCLMDEFGTGTEPQLGAAIAEAILEALHGHEVYGVITTHYANLKFLADRTAAISNAAMKYDVENMSPLFELEQGKPGSSFALEIAQKIGLPKAIIARARQKIGQKQVSVEELLLKLATEEKQMAEQKQQLEISQKQYTELLAKYEKLALELEENKKQIIQKAKTEAKTIIEQANRQIENTIRAIKENKAEKEATKTARRELDELKTQITEQIEPTPDEIIEELPGQAVVIGDYVRIGGQNAIGQLMAISGRDATVLIGSLRTTTRLNRLIKVSRKEYREQNKSEIQPSGVGVNILEKKMEFSAELDLRGKRAEEVLGILDRFMDTALLAGEVQLRIVHGKGNGVLREVVRGHLKGYRQVKGLRDEHADRGGAGVTIVDLV